MLKAPSPKPTPPARLLDASCQPPKSPKYTATTATTVMFAILQIPPFNLASVSLCGLVRKFLQRYVGPYGVLRPVTNLIYEIATLPLKSSSATRPSNIVHMTSLNTYHFHSPLPA